MEKQRAGLIVTDLMDGDAIWQLCTEEVYNKIYEDGHKKDTDKFFNFVEELLYNKEEDRNTDDMLKEFFTQTFVCEKVDLSEYEIIGVLTLSELL